jgi:hypothetical protein
MDRIIASKGKEAAASCRHLFEALVYRNPYYTFLPSECWNCDPLPPPPPLPYVRRARAEDDSNTSSLEISSYAVVKDDRSGGSHICISVDGVGTYRFDTENHEWSEVAKWTLPFQGKVEPRMAADTGPSACPPWLWQVLHYELLLTHRDRGRDS